MENNIRKRPFAQAENEMSYETFMKKMEVLTTETDPATLPEKTQKLLDYIKLNFRRSVRGKKVAKFSEPLVAALKKIDEPQYWMVITEDWCGDSAQTLPFIAAMAELNEKIDLFIIPRDENLPIMDQYLTNGKRAIPKLIAFNSEGKELFQWGPRPETAANLFREKQEKGIAKDEIMPELHLWYGRDRGKAVMAEFLEVLSK